MKTDEDDIPEEKNKINSEISNIQKESNDESKLEEGNGFKKKKNKNKKK
jgi:hypothetical protein